MPKKEGSGKRHARDKSQPTASGEGSRKELAYGRGGPGGAQEGRAESNVAGSNKEVLSQSQRGSAIARGPGQPEKPIDVGAEPYDMEKTGGVPGGMSGMENEGNTGVHRGDTEYPAVSPDVNDIIGSKRGQARKGDKK